MVYCRHLTATGTGLVVLGVLLGVVAVLAIFGVIGYSGSVHQERYITTVHTVLEIPVEYAGVKLNLAYYYKKDEARLRIVASLPEGYPDAASVNDDNVNYVRAKKAFPPWACHLNPLSDDTDWSIYAWDSGNYGFFDGTQADAATMFVDNDPDVQGYWQIISNTAVDLGANTIYLGNTACTAYYNDTYCFADTIGQMSFVLNAPIDRAAWATHYDAAAL